MTSEAKSHSLGSALAPGQDLRAELAQLTSLLGTRGTEKLEGVLGSIHAAAEQVLLENAGMADELICLYEQIGVIFEVTRKLPDVQSEEEILQVFAASLRRSFGEREVALAWRDSGTAAIGWRLEGTNFCTSPWLDAVLSKCANRGNVTIELVPAGDLGNDMQELMLAPIFSGDELVAMLVLARGSAAVAFRAGEMLLLESLTTFCGDLIRNHRLVRELRVMSMAMVRSLVNAVDQKDEYTSGHSLRVASYAEMLGRSLKLSEPELQMLQWSALLHDVGKIGIRDSVLKKEGKLTDEEFQHIKEHPTRSYQVVRGVPQLAGALDGILYHHERYDGRGYPQGLKGETIPLQARIIQIADVFDALTSNRSYRPAYSWEKALEIMDQEAGTALDPALEKTFAALIRSRAGGEPQGWDELVRSTTAGAAERPAAGPAPQPAAEA